MRFHNSQVTPAPLSRASLMVKSCYRYYLVIFLAVLPVSVGVTLWHLSSWRPKIRLVSSAPVRMLRWSADGTQLCISTSAAGWDQAQSLTVDAFTLEVVTRRKLHVVVGVSPFALSPDEKMLAVVGNDVDDTHSLSMRSWIKLFNTQNGKMTSQQSSCEISSLAFSPDGERLLAGAESCGTSPIGESGNWSLWEIREQKLGRLLSDHEEPAQAIAWKQDGRLAWFALRGGEVGSVTRYGKVFHRFNLWNSVARDERDATALALSPDDKTFALATSETTPKSFAHSVSILDAKAGHILNSWHPTAPTTALSFAPQGNQLAVADAQSVTLHPMNDSTSRTLPSIGVTSLAFSPDGSRLALGTSKGEIQIWRIK